jgi:ABC-type Co2+ transport system permease subunit
VSAPHLVALKHTDRAHLGVAAMLGNLLILGWGVGSVGYTIYELYDHVGNQKQAQPTAFACAHVLQVVAA